ncbi:MAG: DNA repair protein RecN [Pseudomonadota bacterium]
MLSNIQIRDFAIIDHVDLELDGGMTVLSGETGAGKSILVDALTLVLGSRADSGVIRHGAKRADITATFDLPHGHPGIDWLAAQDLDAQGECIIRRTIQEGGRSRAYINGHAVPLQTVRGLGELLGVIHGQHEHQTLTQKKQQQQILDHHGDHQKLLEKVSGLFDTWQELQQELEALEAAQVDREARLDLLGYQINELEALNLSSSEVAELEEEHQRLANVGKLMSGVQTALACTSQGEQEPAQQQINTAIRVLKPLAEVDGNLKASIELLEAAAIQLGETEVELSRYADALEANPERLNYVESRISTMDDLARKHRIEPDQLPQWLIELRKEHDQLDQSESHLSQLRSNTSDTYSEYLDNAGKLTKGRKKAAKKLSQAISNMMQTLGMPGGKFEVGVSEGKPTKDGQDQIEFLVSANPGQPPKPLSKVASGGELARISLAIQVVAANATPSTTMVFDEVDSGVGGGVAEIVGRQLRNLGDGQQVLCVTHLPQVASQAHHHVRVSKITDGETTRTSLSHLNADETIEEIARMLGGVDITVKTRQHAKEMLAVNKN